jgi:anti-anti-sigma factor
MIQIETRQVNNVLLIEMSGRLDSLSAGEAEDRLLNIVEGKDGWVLLKLERLEYLTSVGLRVIVRLAKLLQESGGELMICNVRGFVKDAFEIFGLHDLTKIYDTEKEAFAAIIRCC